MISQMDHQLNLNYFDLIWTIISADVINNFNLNGEFLLYNVGGRIVKTCSEVGIIFLDINRRPFFRP